MVIKKLVLAENHRVIDYHRFEQHAVSVFDCRGRHHHQSGIVRVNGFERLAVKWSAARRSSSRQPHDDGAGDIRAPIHRRRLIHDLVEAHRRKVGELHFDDRTHPMQCRADSRTNHRVFTDGRIKDASGKFLREMLGGLERATEFPDVLAVDIDARIFAQGLGLRLANCLQIGNAHPSE